MQIFTTSVEIATEGDDQVIDITGHVGSALVESGVEEGSALVHVAHSTCAVTTMEYEPGAVADLRAWLENIAPRGADYSHNTLNHDSNGHAHLRAAVIGPSVLIPVSGGRLLLGTWQTPVLVDFDDRPRRRVLQVQIMGK